MAEHPVSASRRCAAALLLLAGPSLLLVSCSAAGVTFTVLKGNFLFRRGEDALAAYAYLQAREGRGGRIWEDWLDYDLGSLYLSIGETGAGLRVLNRALEGFNDLPREPNRRDKELFFRVLFNRGVALYEIGSYREAAGSFIQALRLKRGSWEAKINLELCIAALSGAPAAGSGQTEGKAPETGTEEREKRSERILEALQEEEKPAWVSAPSGERYDEDW